MANLDKFKKNHGTSLFGVKTSNEVSVDLSEYEKFSLNQVEAGVEFTGKPSAMRFEPDEDNNYTNFRLQLVNDKDMQVLKCYCNIPLSYPVVTKLYKSNNFMKTTFDCITSVMYLLDAESVIDADGNDITCIEEINIDEFIKFLDELEEITVKVTENGDYNSFIVKKFK